MQQVEISSPSVEPKIKTIRSKFRYFSNPCFFAIFGVSFYNLIIKAVAKVTFTPSIEAIGGKIGNFVYAQNRAGAYIRKRVVPKNPKTKYQDEARALLTESSKSWGSITKAQRVEWNVVAGSRISKGKGLSAGTSSLPSGKALYQECYINAKLLGATTRTSPELNPLPFASTPKELIFKSIELEVFLSFNGAVSAVGGVYCSLTPELSAGTSFYGTKYKGLGAKVGKAGETDIEFTSDFASRFGSAIPTSGNRSCLVRLIDSGFYSGQSLVVGISYV